MSITNNSNENYFQKDSDNSWHWKVTICIWSLLKTKIFVIIPINKTRWFPLSMLFFGQKSSVVFTHCILKFHNPTDLNPVDLSHGLRGCCVSEAAGPRALHGCDGGGNRQLKSSHPHQKPLMRLKGENIMFNNNFGTQKVHRFFWQNYQFLLKSAKLWY